MGEESYFGWHPTVFDQAGRITVPKRFYELMERQDHVTWHVMPGLNGNLYLYNRTQWDRLLQQDADSYEIIDQEAHLFFGFKYGCTAETRVDRQGRMPIPGQLRSLAGMDREVVLVGSRDRLELWSKDAWETLCREMWAVYGKRATELSARSNGRGTGNGTEASGTREKGGQEHGHSADGNGIGNSTAS